MNCKMCSKCKETKPLSEFNKDKSKKSGYKSQCKECIKSNPKRNEYLVKYRQDHKDYFKQKHAEYRERNREKLREISKQRRLANPELTRLYYEKNRERILEYCRIYNNSEHGKEVRRAYNKSEKRIAYKTYQRHLRRSVVKDGDKDITLSKLYDRDRGVCKICGRLCDHDDYTLKGNVFVAGNKYPSIDHIKPLSKGGSHTWDNVQLAHRQCNSIKRDKEAI